MTIHFVPGDPNPSPNSLHQVLWRNHHIIAYSSGNNVIIYTVARNQPENIQTLSLETEVGAISINDRNGLICVALSSQVVVLGLVDEYLTVLRWQEKMRLENDGSSINCLLWATEEDEIVIGTDKSLSLYHLCSEYGDLRAIRRWTKDQPSPLETVAITSDGSKIASYCRSNCDSFAKVWLRISYGDESTLFDLVYADHDLKTYLVDLRWRKKAAQSANNSEEAFASMLHIKNMRTVMSGLSQNDNDVLYTVTADKKIHFWATCESNGHNYLRLCYTLDLAPLVDDYVTSLWIESSFMADLLANTPKESLAKGLGPASMEIGKFDILFVMGTKITNLYTINVSENPSSSISLIRVCSFTTNKQCLPHYRAKILSTDENTSLLEYVEKQTPIGNRHVVVMPDRANLSFLMHDYVKNSIRCTQINAVPSFRGTGMVSFLLLGKFQGHSKPIRKLIASSSSHENNIMLSVSDHPEHNYIWEPLQLDYYKSSMSITKRFRLNVAREDNKPQGVLDAAIINDIVPSVNGLRHHLIVVAEKGDFLSVWDCDGVTMDDNDVKLVRRLPIMRSDLKKELPNLRTLFLCREDAKVYVVVAIYDAADHCAWKLDVDAGNTACQPIKFSPFPGVFSGNIQVSSVDTFLEKDVSVIDQEGRFSLFSGALDKCRTSMQWTRICSFNTSIKDAQFIRGASIINKVAVVDKFGSCLSIWDTRFSNLEFEETYPKTYGPVRDIDWTFIGSKGSSANALLSVGFLTFVLVYAQLRYDYTNLVPTFAVLKRIDISQYSTLNVADLIWLDDANFVIGSGNQFFVDDKFVELGNGNHGVSTTDVMDSTVRQLLLSTTLHADAVYLLSHLVKILNGPLPVYHPQFLIQAFLINEPDAVEAVLVRLLAFLRKNEDVPWDLQINFLNLLTQNGKSASERCRHSIVSITKNSGFDVDLFGTFNTETAELLIEKLATMSLPLLTRHQQGTLRNLVITLKKLQPQRASLDENGYKFMCVFELFRHSPKQKKLSMRDISWALHSDQKEVIYATVRHAYQRLDWAAVKSCGLVYWLDARRLTELVDTVAQCEFATERDASGRVSVLYLAIRKKQLLMGLWKTTLHPEREKVLKFLGNDFSQRRWKSAAEKNAFVLLSKHRYLDAAYFFLLANKVRDCCHTLCSKLDEIDLALAIAKVNEDRSAVRLVIERYILPQALAKGDRWYTSWAFWELGLAEISIQALVKGPRKVVQQNATTFLPEFRNEVEQTVVDATSRSFLRDDPVLAGLYEKLRGTQINYYQGSKAVLPAEEFDFVVRVASIYARMGCDYLALMMLRNWRFEAPTYAKKEKPVSIKKDLFLEFKMDQSADRVVSAAATFEEPDMSSFSFGF